MFSVHKPVINGDSRETVTTFHAVDHLPTEVLLGWRGHALYPYRCNGAPEIFGATHTLQPMSQKGFGGKKHGHK